MGLIAAALGAAGGVMADQWKEYFYCESMPENVLAVKGQKRNSGRSTNTKGNDNIITDGSIVAVADGQCMIIVEQGKVVDVCAEPGEYKYDTSTEPSIFTGKLNGESIKNVFKQIGKRFTFGGEAPMDQRIYYINTKELMGNKYGTPSPVPFKVVDEDIGFKTNIGIKCFGEYSYRITNPILFYTNVCTNFTDTFVRDSIDGQLKTELLTALQPAFASLQRVDYTALPAHTLELADSLNIVLSSKWRDLRGIEIVSFGISSVKASEEDEARLQKMQEAAFVGGGNVMAGNMAAATADAMRDAAKNPGGAGMAFMGMNMAQNTGMNAMGGMNMGQQPNVFAQQQAQPAAGTWTCECGTQNTGKFCANCGKPKPENDAWTCECGTQNTGKFCANCGKPKPANGPWTCECGTQNTGKFCANCGKPRP